MIICTKRAWVSKDPARLVADGDETAVHLLARVGQNVQEKDVQRFENASEFFTGFKEDAPVPKGKTEQAAPSAPDKAKKSRK